MPWPSSNDVDKPTIRKDHISIESLHASWVRNGFLASNVGTNLILIGLTLRTTIGESTTTKVLSIIALFVGLLIVSLGFLYATFSTNDYRNRSQAIDSGLPVPMNKRTKWVYPLGIGQALVISVLLLVLLLITINNGFD